MIDPILDFIVAVCCILALLAVFVKRKGKTPRAEPITSVIVGTSFLIWIFAANLPGHTNGKLWIEAKRKGDKFAFDRTTLTLKKNGNFTLDFFHVDFGCAISGAFKKSGDTIYLDDESIARVGRDMDTAYIIKNNSLIPLNNTDSLKQFNIVTIK